MKAGEAGASDTKAAETKAAETEANGMKANLEIEINSPEIAKRAIAIEKPKNSRVIESISTDKNKLTLTIKSNELKALKAALNSNLSWLEVAEKFSEKSGEEKSRGKKSGEE